MGPAPMHERCVSTCSIALNHLPVARAFELIASAGFGAVDVHEKVHLSLFESECDPEALMAAAGASGLRIGQLATYVGGGLDGRRTAYSFHGWEVANPERFTSVGFASDDAEELEQEFGQMQRAIDLAALFGSRCIRVVPGDDRPESLEKIVPWFRRSAEYSAARGVYLGVENHSAGIAGTPELCAELADKVGSPHFGILYEPANLLHDTGADYRRALEIMSDHIVHVHFKDCSSIEEGCEMVHFGEGVIDFPWIVGELDAAGYRGDIATEYEIHSTPAEQGLRRFHDDFLSLFEG